MQDDIHVVNLSLSYQEKFIFLDLNLSIPFGSKIAILGKSGIGKTSLLRLFAGLTTDGVTVSGTILNGHGKPIHQQIAYMAQQDLLLPWLTTLQNVLLQFKLHRYSKIEYKRKVFLAEHLLKQSGLENAKNFYPHQLSSGMRQRAALVRTLLTEKPIILMDEPFSALDTITRYHLQNLTRDLIRDKTHIFITHDPAEAVRLANQIYMMEGNPATIKLLTTSSDAEIFAQLVRMDAAS